ncbi:MAG: hypothetical protein ACE5FO_03075 [Parvularculaceae bacterium]
MKTAIAIGGVFAAATFAFAAAQTGDFKEGCVAAAPEGVDSAAIEATCSCLENVTADAPNVRQSLVDASAIADRDERFAALIPEAQDAVLQCRGDG